MEQGDRIICQESLACEERLGHRRMVPKDWGCQQEGETEMLFSQMDICLGNEPIDLLCVRTEGKEY